MCAFATFLMLMNVMKYLFLFLYYLVLHHYLSACAYDPDSQLIITWPNLHNLGLILDLLPK